MSDLKPIKDPDHLLPAPPKKAGPTIGIVIILLVLIVGDLCFVWHKAFYSVSNPIDQVPYIPAGTTTLPVRTSTSSALP